MQKINTEAAPQAIGPYSQAILIKSFIFVSGQLPVDPSTGKLVERDIQASTQRVIDNIEAILNAAGSSLQNVVRTEVFMIDLKEFAKMNEIYARRFNGAVLPARQTIQVAALPMGSCIEISCIAVG
jgi:2-iminobutanoate/2-iminopropanoate deaminase